MLGAFLHPSTGDNERCCVSVAGRGDDGDGDGKQNDRTHLSPQPQPMPHQNSCYFERRTTLKPPLIVGRYPSGSVLIRTIAASISTKQWLRQRLKKIGCGYVGTLHVHYGSTGSSVLCVRTSCPRRRQLRWACSGI